MYMYNHMVGRAGSILSPRAYTGGAQWRAVPLSRPVNEGGVVEPRAKTLLKSETEE